MKKPGGARAAALSATIRRTASARSRSLGGRRGPLPLEDPRALPRECELTPTPRRAAAGPSSTAGGRKCSPPLAATAAASASTLLAAGLPAPLPAGLPADWAPGGDRPWGDRPIRLAAELPLARTISRPRCAAATTTRAAARADAAVTVASGAETRILDLSSRRNSTSSSIRAAAAPSACDSARPMTEARRAELDDWRGREGAPTLPPAPTAELHPPPQPTLPPPPTPLPVALPSPEPTLEEPALPCAGRSWLVAVAFRLLDRLNEATVDAMLVLLWSVLARAEARARLELQQPERFVVEDVALLWSRTVDGAERLSPCHTWSRSMALQRLGVCGV